MVVVKVIQHLGADQFTGLPQVSLAEYDVVGPNGEKLNEEPLSIRAAERLRKAKLSEYKARPALEEDMLSEETNVEITWKKIGGGSFRMANGKIIKPNQVFKARPDEIPQAFRDVVRPLEPIPSAPPLEVATGGYEIRSVGPGWYAVFDCDGKRVNEKSLRQKEAKDLLESLGG